MSTGARQQWCWSMARVSSLRPGADRKPGPGQLQSFEKREQPFAEFPTFRVTKSHPGVRTATAGAALAELLLSLRLCRRVDDVAGTWQMPQVRVDPHAPCTPRRPPPFGANIPLALQRGSLQANQVGNSNRHKDGQGCASYADASVMSDGPMLPTRRQYAWCLFRMVHGAALPGLLLHGCPRQGGIDYLENPMVAAVRELQEETGITSARIVAAKDEWLHYDSPTCVRSHFTGRWVRFKGQTQKWCARCLGQAPEPVLEAAAVQRSISKGSSTNSHPLAIRSVMLHWLFLPVNQFCATGCFVMSWIVLVTTSAGPRCSSGCVLWTAPSRVTVCQRQQRWYSRTRPAAG